MSRTGSTYERKRPGSLQARLRLALIVGLLLAAVTTAHAGWVTKNVQGTPNEVRVWAPGVYSVATNDGAYLERPDAGTPMFVPVSGGAVGAYYAVPSNCFVAFGPTGNAFTAQPCTPPPTSSIITTSDLKRVRFSESGAGYALARAFGSTDTDVAFGPAGINGAWSVIDPGVTSDKPADALGVLRMGSTEEALVASNRNNTVNFAWYRGTNRAANFVMLDSVFPARDVQAIDLFPAEATTPTALFGWATGLYRGTLSVSNPQPFSVVPLPVSGAVTTVDMNVGAGSGSGEGFGMATVVRDGGVTLLSAVPAGPPQEIGTQWRVSTKLPAAAVSPRYLACKGSTFCVMAQKTPDVGNVFVYTNAAAPVVILEPDPPMPNDQAPYTFKVKAQDNDGDAVRLVVSPSTPPGVTVSPSPDPVSGDVDVTVSASALCQNVTVPVTITASDGLNAHDQVNNLTLQVLHTLGPGAPVVGFTQKTVWAGDSQLTISVTPPANPPCPIVSYVWKPVSSGSPPLTVSTDTKSADFQPPSYLCNPLGESHLYSVEAIDEAGVASAPTYFTLQVWPYGPPEAPFDGGVQANLISGDPANGSVWFTPMQSHRCSGSTGFPGLDTVWEVVDGGPVRPGVRLLAADAGPVSGSSVVTPQLGVEADACAQADLVLSVRHYTRGSSEDAGPPSTVTVHAEPVLIPVDQATLNLTSDLTTPEAVSGEVSAAGLNCLELRKGLRAHIALLRDDGGIRDEDTFPVPGRWWFPLGDVCHGARYTVKGELLEDTFQLRGQEVPGPAQGASVGAFSGPVSSTDVTVPAVDLALEADEDAHITARCGEPARGVLEHKLPVGPCSELPLFWTWVSGPRLTQDTFDKQRIELETQETDFGALIGQTVVLHATANIGQGNEFTQPVRILAEPFIASRRQTEPLTGSDTDLVGVSIELSNTTACSVSAVDHVEQLQGVDYVPGSARFNGAPVEATVEGGALTLRGIALEGNSTGRLTYVVRPRLLGTASLRGDSFIRGVPISQPQVEPSSSCGCAGGGSGFAALGLAGLAAVLRRRKAR